MGGDKQWDTFDLRWIDATRELEEPFQSTEFECGHSQFSDESKRSTRKRDALMECLVTLIREYRLRGCAAVIAVDV